MLGLSRRYKWYNSVLRIDLNVFQWWRYNWKQGHAHCGRTARDVHVFNFVNQPIRSKLKYKYFQHIYWGTTLKSDLNKMSSYVNSPHPPSKIPILKHKHTLAHPSPFPINSTKNIYCKDWSHCSPSWFLFPWRHFHTLICISGHITFSLYSDLVETWNKF